MKKDAGMERTLESKSRSPVQQKAADAIWVALVAVLSVLGSAVFACAAPLAAIAALAATKMRALDGLALVITAWLVNQILGFAVLGYPQTWDSFAWGGAIGFASALAFLGARRVTAANLTEPATLACGFLVAFAIYEAGLYALTAILPSSAEVFSLAVVGRVFVTNAIAFVGLLLLHRLAIALTLLRPVRALDPASA